MMRLATGVDPHIESSAKKSRGPASLTCWRAVNRDGPWPPARSYLQATPRLPLARLPQAAVKSDWHTGSNSDNRGHVSGALKKSAPRNKTVDPALRRGILAET